jgi:KDO2-lipid IV(A) lauroyltransferase
MKKSFMKYLIGISLRFISFLIHIQPRRWILFWGDLLAVLIFDGLRFRRQITMANLELAFPEMSHRNRTKIARGSYRTLGRVLFEYAHFSFITKDWVAKNFEFEGLQNIEKARAKGKGVMILSLHLGSGDLALASLAYLGYPIHLISKHFRSQWLNELWFGLREKIGMKFIPEEKSSYQILRAIKGGGMVVFVLDQFMGPPAGVSTKFFGVKTGTASGLATFSLRSGAPVVPAYVYRKPSGQSVMCFEPEIQSVSTNDQVFDVSKLTQAYTNKIEEIVRKYPDQWMWLHRRWKTFEVR